MAYDDETRRLQAQLDAAIRRISDRHVRELVAMWAIAWDEINLDLTAALLDQLVAGERITRAQLLRSTRLRTALALVARRLALLAEASSVTITRDLQAVVDTAGAAQASIIDSQLPPGFMSPADLAGWSRVDPEQVAAIVARATEQITARSWALSQDAYDVMRRELVRGVAVGSNPRVTARRIIERSKGGFDGGLTRAMTVARTETLDAYRSAAQLGQAQHVDVLAGWVWLASLGPRTCPACFAMHGTVHGLDEPGPQGHQQCRCSRAPKTKDWADLGFDGIEEPPSLLQDADEVFAGLTPREQQDILGKRGYQAWLAGKFPREKWAVRRKTDGWRDSHVIAKPPALAAGGHGVRVPPPVDPPPGGYGGPDAPKPGRVTRSIDPATGKVVKLQEHEIVTAYRIASLGFDIHFQPNPHDGTSADALILGLLWEIKAPPGAGLHVIAGNLTKAQRQADRAVLDLYRSGLTAEQAAAQIAAWLENPRNRLAALWVLPENVREHWTWER